LFQKLHLPGGSSGVKEFLEDVKDFRPVEGGLFEKRSGWTTAHFEINVRSHQVGEQTQGGDVTALGSVSEDGFVFLVPEKRGAVGGQAKGLVQMKA